MEINLNNNGLGNIVMGREPLGTSGPVAGNAAKETPEVPRSSTLRVSDSPSKLQADGLASSEPVAVVPDSALSRDDALGRLVNAAFNFAPPQMPAFDS